MKLRTSLFLPFFLLWCKPGAAQTAAPLSKLHIQAGAVAPFHVSAPYDRYHVNLVAFRMQFGANINKGELYLAAARNHFSSDSFPDFSSSIFTLGYAHNIGILKKTWLKPGIAIGNHFMQFTPLPYTSHQTESELLMEASLNIQSALYKKLHLLAGVSYQHTMLFHRFDTWNASIALVYYMNTPKLLKKLID